jgi:hypothetical protein
MIFERRTNTNMHIKHFCTTTILLLILLNDASGQYLSGRVRSVNTQVPLAGATITVRDGQSKSKKYATQSDSSGMWSIADVRPGILEVEVSLLGYQVLLVPEIQVAAGKDQFLDLSLVSGTTPLPVVDIIGTRGDRQMQALGELPLSREQTLRYPATFFDPVRLATALPGVASADDGSNNISVRGNNPAFVRWRLMGSDIVSPNHLPNANTFNDLPAVAGGGVLMLSAQMIDNSALISGNADPEYGDAVSGIVDLKLRKGNARRAEQTIQAGLLGFDFALEGPLGKRGISYLVNYRYSFTGLLGALGVSFGGERIGFSDLAFHIHKPGRFGSTSIYGIFGRSSNIYLRPDSLPTFDKELADITYYSRANVVGLTHTVRMHTKSTLEGNISVSNQRNEHERRGIGIRERSFQNEHRVYIGLTWIENFSDNFKVKVGFISHSHFLAQREGTEFESFVNRFRSDFRSFISAKYQFDEGKGWIQLGAHPTLKTWGLGALYFDPRVAAQYYLGKHSTIGIGAGVYSQSRLINMRALTNGPNTMKASHIALRYAYTSTSGHWIHRAEVFRQAISNIPIETAPNSTYSAFNDIEFNPSTVFSLQSEGLSRTYGVEMGSERFLSKGWFLNANMTLLRSEYTMNREEWLRSRWDIGHVANLTIGREWSKKVKKSQKKQSLWGFNARIFHMGGYRALPIDESLSAAAQGTIYVTTEGYSVKNKPYFRTDTRIYWKRNVPNKRNHTIALDLQNVSSQANIGWQYYDTVQDRIRTREQLGLVPNLSWRVEF